MPNRVKSEIFLFTAAFFTQMPFAAFPLCSRFNIVLVQLSLFIAHFVFVGKFVCAQLGFSPHRLFFQPTEAISDIAQFFFSSTINFWFCCCYDFCADFLEVVLFVIYLFFFVFVILVFCRFCGTLFGWVFNLALQVQFFRSHYLSTLSHYLYMWKWKSVCVCVWCWFFVFVVGFFFFGFCQCWLKSLTFSCCSFEGLFTLHSLHITYIHTYSHTHIHTYAFFISCVYTSSSSNKQVKQKFSASDMLSEQVLKYIYICLCVY